MGYQTLACPESFAGTNIRAMEEEVNRKAAAYKSVLLPTYEERENKGVTSNFLLKIPCHALWPAPKMNTMLNYADDKDSNSISAAAIE